MPNRARAAGIRRLRFTRERYHRFFRKQVLRPDHRIELLNGVIYEPLRMSDGHWWVLNYLRNSLVRLSKGGWFVTSRCPIALGRYSESEPDIAIVRGEVMDYRHGHPQARDTPVVIEVSDETLRFDRGRRLRVYAQGGLTEYWIVNLVDRCVEVRTEPRVSDGDLKARYERLRVYRGDESVPLCVNGETVTEYPVTELIPL